MKRYSQGFSLFELLIAMSIFAIITSIAYSGLNQFAGAYQKVSKSSKSMAILQKALTLLERDLLQMAPRSVRDEAGGFRPAMISADNYIEFSRFGAPYFGVGNQSSLLRIRYEIDDDDNLLRKSWNFPDVASNSTVTSVIVLSKVKDFKLNFLFADDWADTWPQEGEISGLDADNTDFQQAIEVDLNDSNLPQAIKIVIDIEDVGEIVRLIPGMGL